MRDFGLLIAIMAVGVLFAGGLLVENGALTVSALLLLGFSTVIAFSGQTIRTSQLIQPNKDNPTPSFLIPLIGMGLVTASGLLVLGGLAWENGILTVSGILLIGIVLVILLRPRRIHDRSQVTGNSRSIFPMTSVLLVSLAGVLIAYGLQQGAGVLTVIGMLGIGLVTVLGLSKASRYV